MGKGPGKKKIQSEIAELEIEKRHGLIRLVAGIVLFIIAAALKQWFMVQGAEWANSTFANLFIFMFAVAMALVAGLGSRDYMRAHDKINRLRNKR